MGNIGVGSRTFSFKDAQSHIETYVSDERYLYQTYDTYSTNDDPMALADGDLLAPVLLNVRVSVSSYKKLRGWRAQLEERLRVLPQNLELRHANESELQLVADCFGVLDGQRWMATTLAKVLHRKNPQLVPLYDQNVRRCYVPVPIGQDPKRSWSEFFRLLARKMQQDLIDGAEQWDRLCQAADRVSEGPPLTKLRALDILAWWPEPELGDGATTTPEESR